MIEKSVKSLFVIMIIWSFVACGSNINKSGPTPGNLAMSNDVTRNNVENDNQYFDARIMGKVTDVRENPIVDASISIVKNHKEVSTYKTDAKGKYVFTFIRGWEELKKQSIFSITKKGYCKYQSSSDRLENGHFKLYKKIRCEDIRNLRKLDGKELRKELSFIFANLDLLSNCSISEKQVLGEFFKLGEQVLPALDREWEDQTAEILERNLNAYLGKRQDLSDMSILSKENRYLLGMLVNPSSESEWKFLEDIISDSDSVHREDAILSLVANGSERAISILKNTDISSLPLRIKRIVDYVKQQGKGIRYYETLRKSIDSIGEFLLIATESAGWEFVLEEVYQNEKNSRVLVFCHVKAGILGGYGYEFVLQKKETRWVLAGIWQTWTS